MQLDLNKLKEGSPKEIEEEIKEIKDLSKKFIDDVEILPNQQLEEVKIDVQKAKDYLFQILSRFLTLLTNLLVEEKELQKVGYRLKFEEDIGSVIKELKEKNVGKIEPQIGITSLLKFAGELKTTYDFLIYHPITQANKTEYKDAEEYIKKLFVTLRANASILGYAGKFTLQPSKQILPKTIDLIKSGYKTEKPEDKGLKDLEGLGSEGETDDEEGFDEEEMEEVDET